MVWPEYVIPAHCYARSCSWNVNRSRPAFSGASMWSRGESTRPRGLAPGAAPTHEHPLTHCSYTDPRTPTNTLLLHRCRSEVKISLAGLRPGIIYRVWVVGVSFDGVRGAPSQVFFFVVVSDVG